MNAPQIQFRVFPDGGFVLHKITSPQFAGRVSAWFAADGTLLDAQQCDVCNRWRDVKRGGTAWSVVQVVGKRYVTPMPQASL